MKFLIVNKALPDDPQLQDFDEAIPIRHYWRSVAIFFFVVMITVIILQLGIDYTFHVNPEYSLSILQWLAFLCVTLLLHELCHMIFLLKHWKKLYLVIQPKMLLIGFTVEDFVKRQEMLITLVAPIFFLSFVPYVVMMILRHFSMNAFIVVCLNLYISIGDIVMFSFIAKNCDRHASVHYSNGLLNIRHADHNREIHNNP